MSRYSGKKCRLLTMLWLTTFFFFIEIVVGYITNSMALVADSFHMLSDVAALFIAFLSVKMSPKKWSKNTFGWARAEVLGALVNAVFLVALCFSISVEAVKRFINYEAINDPKLLLIVGVIGLIVNIIGLLLFHDHGHSHGGITNRNPLTKFINNETAIENEEEYHQENHLNRTYENNPRKKSQHGHHHSHDRNHTSYQMNMHGVFLHVLSDALGSVIVIISALIFWKTNWEYRYYIDPALSILLVILILNSVWPLLRDSALILLQTVPTHIQVDAIEQRLLAKVDGVIGVHEFHVWQLAGDRIIASAHIRCRNLSEYMKIAEQVKEFFHNEGIHSTTMQPEFIEDIPENNLFEPDQSEDCVLDCPKTDNSCAQSTCCGPSKQERESLLPIVDNQYDCRQRTCNSQMEKGPLLFPLKQTVNGLRKDCTCNSTGNCQCQPPSTSQRQTPSISV